MSTYRKFSSRFTADKPKTFASFATFTGDIQNFEAGTDTDGTQIETPKIQSASVKVAQVAKVESEAVTNPTSGCLQNPQNPRSPPVQVCVQCGAGDDLWHLDTPTGPVLIHEECARFWPGAPPALPIAAVHHQASGDPGGITTEVRIFTLPAGQHYRKVLVALMGKCPDHVPEERWKRAVEDAKAFVRTWGEQAHSLSWSNRDLFGLAPVPERPGFDRLARYDLTGLIWCLCGRPVTMLTADSATIKTTNGTLNFYRHTRPAYGPLGDSLGDLR